MTPLPSLKLRAVADCRLFDRRGRQDLVGWCGSRRSRRFVPRHYACGSWPNIESGHRSLEDIPTGSSIRALASVTRGGTLATHPNCARCPRVMLTCSKGVFPRRSPTSRAQRFDLGNPNLGAETAKSFTAGVVINPRNIAALRNLVLSVDYYSIKVDDAITFPARTTTLQQCYVVGDPTFCQFITRRPAQSGSSSPGSLAFVDSAAVNSGVSNPRLDTVLQYRTISTGSRRLNLNARVSWTPS